jgi:hypothetical protein
MSESQTECGRCREMEEQLKRETQRRKDVESERNTLKAVTDRLERRRDPVLFRDLPDLPPHQPGTLQPLTPPPSTW